MLCAEERAARTKRDLDGHESRLEQYSERRLEQYFDETVARTTRFCAKTLGPRYAFGFRALASVM